jgi:hypothetical protein
MSTTEEKKPTTEEFLTYNPDRQNDKIRAQVEREIPTPRGGFASDSELDEHRAKHDARFIELCKNPAAVALGRLGGSANTPAQNKARAINAKKGGWPKGRPRKDC